MRYFAHVTGIRESEKGTDLIIHIPGEQLGKQIRKYAREGVVDAEIKINDGRRITPEQNRKMHALIRDIAMYTGDIGKYTDKIPEDLKQSLKVDYCQKTGEKLFSTSDCSISLARDFIGHIIDFVLEWDIPLADTALKYTEDADRYLYGCIKHRKCAITGGDKAGIYHVKGSVAGKLKLIALNAEWSRKVVGGREKEIFEKYKIYGITINDEALKDLNLEYEDIT